MEQSRPLTNVQRELLELFALNVPDKQLRDIRRLLARYFAGQATTAMDRHALENDLTAEDLGRWADAHERAAADRT